MILKGELKICRPFCEYHTYSLLD